MRKSDSSLLSGTWVDRVWGTKVKDKRKAAKQDASDGKPSINPPRTAARVSRVLTTIALVAITIAAFAETEISASNFFFSLANLPETMALFLPPSSGGIAGEIFQLLLDTLQIAFAATFLGAILAIPIGIMAASNVVANKWVHGFFRVLIVIIRGIPELILAIIFVVISGLGPVAGTLALARGAVGLLSKLVADSLEETDTDVQEALRTTGATESQILFAATVHQAIPSFIAPLPLPAGHQHPLGHAAGCRRRRWHWLPAAQCLSSQPVRRRHLHPHPYGRCRPRRRGAVHVAACRRPLILSRPSPRPLLPKRKTP